jgi:hypothetical protein
MLDEYEQWVIHAPHLQHLLINSKFDYWWQIDGLPSLEVADINCTYYSADRYFVNHISVLAQARKLKLTMPVSRFTSIPICLFVCIYGLLALDGIYDFSSSH